jgi:hypothetical protein
MTTDAEKMILIERLDRAIESKNRMMQRAKDESMVYLHAGETALAAGIVGYYEGRTGKQNLIDGIPLDFAVAAAGFGLGFFGLSKNQAGHAYAVGSGGLSIYAYKWGREMGQKMSAPPPAAAAGQGVAGALGGGLTDAELSRLVQASRQL